MPGLTVRQDHPLIGIVFIEDSQEVTRSFADETEADDAVASQATDARVLSGVWCDLDWEKTVAELDRTRHENPPAPVIDDP